MADNVSQWPIANTTLTDAERAALEAKLLKLLSSDKLTELSGYELAKLLREFDAVLQSLNPKLLTFGLNDKAHMRLYNALGQLDTKNSQILLAGLATLENNSAENKFRALRALAAGTREISDELLTILSDTLSGEIKLEQDELTSSYYLTMGILLSSRVNNANSLALEQNIIDTLNGTQDEALQSALVGALGNGRNQENVELINDYMDSPSNRVKRSAIRALGQVGGDKAYDKLSGIYDQVQTPRLTKTLIGALSNFEVDEKIQNKVLGTASNHNDESIRLTAIKAMRKQDKDFSKEFKSMLSKEKSRRNFKELVSAIHSKKD